MIRKKQIIMVNISDKQNEILIVSSMSILLLIVFIVIRICCRIQCEFRNYSSQPLLKTREEDNSEYSPPILPNTPPGQGAERYA